MSAKVVVSVAAAGILAVAATIVAPWEGLRTTPYKDLVGVTTVCYGSTRYVEARDYTVAECKALLQSDLATHWAGVSRCIRRPLKENEGAAVLSLAFNVGVRAVCNSGMVRKINEGRPAAEFCRELFKWVYAGGRKVRGLENRRKAEYKVCMGYSQ